MSVTVLPGEVTRNAVTWAADMRRVNGWPPDATLQLVLPPDVADAVDIPTLMANAIVPLCPWPRQEVPS